MKKLELHPLSVVVGAGAAMLGILALGAQSPTTYQWPIDEITSIVGIPKPEDRVFISSNGVPLSLDIGQEQVVYQVPDDRWLVVQNNTENGYSVLWREGNGSEHLLPAIGSIPFAGISIPPGSEVVVRNPGGVAFAYSYTVIGHLIDA